MSGELSSGDSLATSPVTQHVEPASLDVAMGVKAKDRARAPDGVAAG